MGDAASAWAIEGKARFQIGDSFYRPQTEVARDLGVLAAALHRQEIGRLRVLDAMAGCGVRALRYFLEGQADAVWANDSNSDIQSVLQGNLQTLPTDRYLVTCWDANRVFFDCYNRQDFYDFIDLDCFGAAAPYLSTSLWAGEIGGLLYLTSTDGRSLTGHSPEVAVAAYGSYTRNHPAAHEQGLRVLIGAAQQQAAAKGLGIQPLFSFYFRNTYRILVRLVPQSGLSSQNYGFLGYCHTCGEYQLASWRQLGKVSCAECASMLTIGGPLWLGPLHEAAFLEGLMTLAQQWHWSERAELLGLMAAEASPDLPPYFYTLGEIGRRGQLDIPPRSALIYQLQDLGYRACPTHINPQAIKTNATLQTCIQAARSGQ
ncbi:tRNA (guanine-N1)-methyltransferase [Leptolyngbya sp. 'hensonii']|uniref:tRNA (guanine-N1)-methyltransferase n=1 Tax=Leptolyngbya sp. 'hensonii' TaxID=1922337 RepID=UPI00094F6029|nr:tRNA (guanine-N1)-methyltransferase [Leptolyngbya sp. 'hensonii']OLP15555.1 tRNA (guanine-N1)-methyltransferase [Leptolyngbya sp. 'hensonii']